MHSAPPPVYARRVPDPRSLILTLAAVVGVAAAGCGGSNVAAQWAATPAATPVGSLFGSVAVSSSGDVYVTGDTYGEDVFGDGILDLGNGVTCGGSDAGDYVFLAKYDSAGKAQWVESLDGMMNISGFNAVAVDASDGVYVAGCVSAEAGVVSFGNGVTVTLTETNNLSNAVLVKYDSSGVAQWAQVASGPDSSCFNALAVDSTGNLYAAGNLGEVGSYDFGNGIEVASTAFADGGEMGIASSAVVVKYSPAGVAQWAQTVGAGPGPSSFGGVAIDAAGDVYAVGGIAGAQTYDFGNGVTAPSTYIPGEIVGSEGSQGVLVKYNASGVAQWAQTSTSGAFGLFGLAVDAAGDAVVSGSLAGPQTFDFGNGVTAIGSLSPDAFTGTVGPQYPLLVKYNSAGTAVWARTATNAGKASYFFSVALDSSDNIVAAGTIFGGGDYDFGNGVYAEAVTSDDEDAILVKYDAAGAAEWARVSVGEGSSDVLGGKGAVTISAVAVSATDDFYMAGGIGGPVSFGDGVTSTGKSGGYDAWSALLVKYR